MTKTRTTRRKIEDFLDRLYEAYPVIKTSKKLLYYNIPVAFDIETTSTYDAEGNPIAFMYEWTVGILGRVIVGRTWEDLLDLFDLIAAKLRLGPELRLPIFVHNLAFEFQFIRLRMEWEKIFALRTYKPVYAISTSGIEFRCSMILSGYSLESLGENLTTYPVRKLVGDLDYKLVRHSGTPMTDQEIAYCVNDVRVVMSYIQEQIELNGNIGNIPLTKTGYVRRFCRKKCLYDRKAKNADKYLRYQMLMRQMQLTPDLYDMLKRAFQGGFTHASGQSAGKLLEGIESFDLTSSYPAVMLSERFPMSAPQYVKIRSFADFKRSVDRYCCVFDAQIVGLETKIWYEHPLSSSRCRRIVNGVEDNGRLVSADSLYTTMTEQDFFIYIKYYKWREFRVGPFVRYERGYLPKDFVLSVLDLYEDKTKLKGIEGEEVNYQLKKGMLNACFGMAVTDICRDEITYTKAWGLEQNNVAEQIKKYNESKNRFLSYEWGVWITAYARRNLFSAIFAAGPDYHYSDTDSVKISHPERHENYFREYNARIVRKVERCLDHYKIPKERACPKTAAGKNKPLGVWEDEGTYRRFKTLGAKRYMTEDEEGNISVTVSGLNKRDAVPYLLQTFGKDRIFNAFCDDLYIPAEYERISDGKKVSATGKNTHRYLDYEIAGSVTDYLGNEGTYHELSAVHLSGAEYSLKLSDAYADYLLNYQDHFLI